MNVAPRSRASSWTSRLSAPYSRAAVLDTVVTDGIAESFVIKVWAMPTPL
jgi:hypothetical protein